MPTLTSDWRNLSSTIQDVSNREYDEGIGLAKLLQEEKYKGKDIALREKQFQSEDVARKVTSEFTGAQTGLVKEQIAAAKLKREQDKITLDEIKQKKEFLDSPITLSAALGAAFKGVSSERAVGIAGELPDVFKMLNIKLDENNPDPNQVPLINGKPMTNRIFGQIAPVVEGILMGSTDQLQQMTVGMTDIKRKLGAESPGPMLTPQEQQALSQDQGNLELLAKYNILKSSYDKYSKPLDKAMLLRDQIATLNRFRGAVKAVNGDTTILTGKISGLETALKEAESHLAIGEKAEGITGLAPGTTLPGDKAAAMAQLGYGLAQTHSTANAAVMVASINKDAHMYTADKNFEAAQLRQKSENLASQRNTYDNIVGKVIPEETRKYIDTKRDKFTGQIKDSKTGEPMTDEQITAVERAEMANRTRTFIQTKVDTMGPDLFMKVHGSIPPGIDLSPVNLRAKVTDSLKGIQSAIGKIDPSDATGNTFKEQVKQSMSQIAKQMMTGDPMQMDDAQAKLTTLTTQVKQYFESQKANTPQAINKAAKNAATTPLSSPRGLLGMINRTMGDFSKRRPTKGIGISQELGDTE